MKCYFKWARGDFADAVKWGKIAQNIKASTDVDTRNDVIHNLALAERDAGMPELALPVFLAGRNISAVIDPEELDEKDENAGHRYGNIGRCRHFMGQIDQALICYQKSALLIEKTRRHDYFLNQGFIRRWIGELLLAKRRFRLAGIFLEAARLRWEQVSPPRASQIVELQKTLSGQIPNLEEMSRERIERTCIDWILGRPVDIGLN